MFAAPGPPVSTYTIMNYVIVESDFSNPQPIATLWAANLHGYDAITARTKIRLGYVENPAEGSILLSLFAAGQPEPQGSLGLVSRRFYLGERPIRAGTAADFVVGVEHRSLGPAMQLLREIARIAASRFEFCYGMPNANAAPVFAAARFRKLGAFQRFAKPLSTLTFVIRYLPVWAGRLVAPVLDALLLLWDRLRELRLPERLDCRDTDWDDSKLDSLWAQRPASLLLSDRSRQMLKWRFGAPGRGQWRLCTFQDNSGNTRGYAVWRIVDGVFEIGDSFSCDPKLWTTAQMLALTRRALCLGSAHSISFECLVSADLGQQLRKAGLLPRPKQRFVFVAQSDVLRTVADDAWYLTDFDEDTS